MRTARPDRSRSTGRRTAPRRTARGRTVLAAAVSVVAAAALLAGCAGASGSGARPSRLAEQGPLGDPVSGAAGVAGRAGRDAPRTVPTTPAAAALPGVGPKTLAEVPADAQQVVLVTGKGHDAPTSTVRLYRRDPVTGWTPAGPVWAAHNALRGWSDDHHGGDLRSPIGVFTLTDAGGRLADPGTKLTYDHAPIGFGSPGTGFHGESLAGAFDYVIAINYNRKPGTSPRDWTRPLGDSRGGGIWLHVDHGGPTHGCVSLPQSVMKTLLRTLTPDRHPVVVMGDAKALAR
ncbi:L,D-peptidoglycan transpeptidase YkuD, ErfK/YbiS/YcfS/YnhG family [Actinacidiphila yanglinensis]|uniref:L,D-peptidoglycan transpeptidase YkuD, ErfK/YbiS/YcfS/YnhG family n=1 Tax=Actinacidiphila yanglinensis TaxID=310779 RepID=A0A1H5ZZ72_9ACTN|nr:L,D-transpeptidase family protein [Actinacidiphila yanglinensis]SEG41813.1 L,D-peptidoglycan transpeptidase YkuD, ErfK/YbiS/YcfS/YnhG family [Actinacidiphila yanglinensis]